MKSTTINYQSHISSKRTNFKYGEDPKEDFEPGVIKELKEETRL
jgi:hypothetical protein